MKKIIFGLLTVMALTFSGCNTSNPKIISGSNLPNELSDEELAKEPVFTEADQQPEYPGGVQAMYKFLADNIKYPTEDAKNKVQGKVYLTFVIGSTGKIRDVEVMKGVSGNLDREAARVIKAMPKWRPGRKDGKPVAVKYNLPIGFALEG